MRGFSRTLLVKTVAALLALLAASPLTAPFMTCDWSDLARDQSTDVIHVAGNIVTAPEVKTPSDLNTTTFTVAVTTEPVTDTTHRGANPLPHAPSRTPARAQVLRI